MAGLARFGRSLPPLFPSRFGGADVFHSPHYAHLPKAFPRGFPERRFLTMYDVIPLQRPDLFAWRETASMRALAGGRLDGMTIVAISNATAEGVSEFLRIAPDRIRVVYPGVDRGIFHRVRDEVRLGECRVALGLPDRPYLLCLNTIEPRKNLVVVLKAFLAARSSGALQDEILVLAGPPGWGRDEEFERLVAEGGRSIVRTGFVHDDLLAPLYSGARAFLYPSLLEGFGMPPLEAMSCGTPVLCSNSSSLPEVVGDAGVLLPPDSPDAWIGALESLTDQLLSELSRKSEERAELFSWERAARELVDVWTD